MESRIRSPEEQKLIDAKIAEIKIKEQQIKRRQQEIEEDKRLAEEQNAVVNLKPAVDNWLPEKTPPLKPSNRVSFGEVEEMNPVPKQTQYRGRGRGRRYDEQKVGGPPPDPISFLADPERDYHPAEANANHYQPPRNNRQEVPSKNLNENWRGEEKRSAPKPGRTEQGDWRGEKQKHVERNWREDASDLCSRDDRVRSANMQSDWRRPQAPSQGRSFHQTSSLNEDQFAEVDHREQSMQMRSNQQYLHGSSENVRDPVDLRNRLTSRKNEARSQSNFTDEDSWHSAEISKVETFTSSSKLPPQNLPEPVRQTAFDTLPAPSNCEVPNVHRTFENDSHLPNSVYYSNANSISGFEHALRAPETGQVFEATRRAHEASQVFEATRRAPEMSQVFEATRRVPESSQILEATRRAPEMNQVFEATLRAPEMNQVFEATRRAPEMNQVFEVTRRAPEMNQVFEATRRAPETNQVFEATRRAPEMNQAFEAPRRAPETNQAFEATRRAPEMNQVFETTRRAPEMNQVYRLENEDHWEGDEKLFLNHSKINYGHEPSRADFRTEETDAWNYHQDCPPQAVNARVQYSNIQNFTEAANLQASERGLKPQTLITNNGQSWTQADPQHVEPHIAANYRSSQGVYPGGQQWHEAKPPVPYPNDPKPPMPYSSEPKPPIPYSNELQYEQAQMRPSTGKPPNPVYPASFDSRHASLNQQVLTANSSNVRQTSALNTGRPDDAYAYFQAKMAKAQAHHISDVDELQTQFSQMYQPGPPDRRMISSANSNSQGLNQVQFAEMNNVNRQPVAYPADAGQWNQAPENMAPPTLNQTKQSINDRLRKSQEQALMGPRHFGHPQHFVSEASSEHDSYGQSIRKGAEVSCQTDEPPQIQSYPSQIEGRHNTNISQRSQPPTAMTPTDNYVMSNNFSGADRYLNAQYDSPPPPLNNHVQLNNYPNSTSFDSRNIPRQSVSQHTPAGQNWTAQNAADIRQFAEQASNLNRNAQPQLNAHHINEQLHRNAQSNVVREASHTENESLLAFQNELVAHATDRIQARVNNALNDRLKKAREAALQERFEPPPQYSPNQMPNTGAVQAADAQRPAGRAIKGCQSQASNARENQLPKAAQPPQSDNWQSHENDSGLRTDHPNVPLPLEPSPDVSGQRDSGQSPPLPDEPAQPVEITLPTCIDLTKPPPVLFPPAAVSPGPTEQFSEEITANIFSSPPPKIPELNPDSEDIDNLIAKPYYQYKSPTNQDFRPKLTFSLEKKGLEKAENQSQSTAAGFSLPSTQKGHNKKEDDLSRNEKASNKEEVVVEKRITAAERVAKLLETPVVLPEHTPSYVLKVLGEEEIKNIKSRTAGSSRKAQNVGS